MSQHLFTAVFSVAAMLTHTTGDGRRRSVWHLSISQMGNPRSIFCLGHLLPSFLSAKITGQLGPLSLNTPVLFLLVTDVHLCSPLIFLNSRKHLQFKPWDLLPELYKVLFFSAAETRWLEKEIASLLTRGHHDGFTARGTEGFFSVDWQVETKV